MMDHALCTQVYHSYYFFASSNHFNGVFTRLDKYLPIIGVKKYDESDEVTDEVEELQHH